MSTLAIRLPADTHGRLREIARQRGMNMLIEELPAVAIAQYDAETRFRVMVARGSVSWTSSTRRSPAPRTPGADDASNRLRHTPR